MRNYGNVGAALATLILLGLLVPVGRGQGPIAAPSPAEDAAQTAAAAQAPDVTITDGPFPLEPPHVVPVWGVAGFRGYGLGDHIAPNGLEFKALFSLELDFNFWIWRSQGVYAFAETQFWAQRAAPGVTNSSQGAFDFSKREFDLTGGAAWNYYGRFEARVFAYSYNNLNRGDSSSHPTGYNDGVGLENRYYLNGVYDALGTEAYDVDRATFVSLGYYPTKDMVDSRGDVFQPGPFAQAHLTRDLLGQRCYLYGNFEFIADQSCTPELFKVDAGVASRPFDAFPRLEFRIGSDDDIDLHNKDAEYGVYGGVRFTY